MNRLELHQTRPVPNAVDESKTGGSLKPLELSLVVPTFNEAGNIPLLISKLSDQLRDISWEVVIVDDHSPDGSADIVRKIARHNPRVRCLERLDERGLASACVKGWLATAAPVIGVMDADLQHDERLLPAMLEKIQGGSIDIVVGSRFAEGTEVGGLTAGRRKLSLLANDLAGWFLKVHLTDPMSGFFMMRREVFESKVPHLSSIGFKILLDLLMSAPRGLVVHELPFKFRDRHAGESKLDARVLWEFAMLLADKLFGRWIPVRFLAFSAVGCIGIGVHFAVLILLFKGAGLDFVPSHIAGTLTAMAGNFVLNNLLTYRDRRLRGWSILRGWITFTLACSIGALANVGVAAYLFEQDVFWAPSAVAGILVGTVWNYAVTKTFTWSKA